MATIVDLKKLLQKSLVASEDMSPEMAADAVELMTSVADKFQANYEKTSQAIKEGMDKKFGPSWHCVIGEGFGFDITYSAKNMIYIYYLEKVGILVFKA